MKRICDQRGKYLTQSMIFAAPALLEAAAGAWAANSEDSACVSRGCGGKPLMQQLAALFSGSGIPQTQTSRCEP